jgi:Heme NO binding associated
MVRGAPHFRFYAGAPLINPEGYALGSLCVLNYQPRAIDARQLKALSWLTRQAVAQLELWRKMAELAELHRSLTVEKSEVESLLHNIVPQKIAEELRKRGSVQTQILSISNNFIHQYRWVPERIAPDSRYNVAQLYARLAEGIRNRKPVNPGFDAAVTRHRVLDAIVRASETGMKQVL